MSVEQHTQHDGRAASFEASLKLLEKESDVDFGWLRNYAMYSLVAAVKDNDDKDNVSILAKILFVCLRDSCEDRFVQCFMFAISLKRGKE